MDLMKLVQGIPGVRRAESLESSLRFMHRAPGESYCLAYSDTQLIAFADSLDYDLPAAVIKNIRKQLGDYTVHRRPGGGHIYRWSVDRS
jgi:hypothetical protein